MHTYSASVRVNYTEVPNASVLVYADASILINLEVSVLRTDWNRRTNFDSLACIGADSNNLLVSSVAEPEVTVINWSALRVDRLDDVPVLRVVPFVVLYHVEVSFFDNFDVLTSAMDKGFEDAGFTRVSGHYWKLNGEKNANNRKAKETFEARAKYIDENRDKIGFAGALALKGEKVTLKYTYGDEKDAVLATYTFVKEDAK